MLNPGALTSGANPPSPETTEYEGPFEITGKLNADTLDDSGELIL
jgi:arylsulfatase